MAENDKAKGKKQVPLRLSASLYDELAKWAEDDFRSINGQIEYLLTECVKRRKKPAPKKKEVRNGNIRPNEAPELNEPFIYTSPDGQQQEFENVKVFLDYVINGAPDERDENPENEKKLEN